MSNTTQQPSELCDCSTCNGEGFVGTDGETCACIRAGCKKRHRRDEYLKPSPTKQPSELAIEIAEAVLRHTSNLSNPLWVAEEYRNIVDAVLCDHERRQWKDASEPPDNGRFVFARDSDSGDVREAFFLSEPLSGNRSWRDWSNGNCFHADKWREYVIPAPPKPPKAKGAK